MHVNVYNEELTDRVGVERKKPKNAPDVEFVGIQFFVDKPWMHTPGDDDSSRVAFWFNSEHGRGLLRTAFAEALRLLDSHETRLDDSPTHL